MKSFLFISLISLLLIPIDAQSKYTYIRVAGSGWGEGSVICKIINTTKKETGMRCGASTVERVEALHSNEVDFIQIKISEADNHKIMRSLFIYPIEPGRIVVTRSNHDEDSVYILTKQIHKYFENYLNMVGAKPIDKKAMMNVGSIPLHKGAERFYREIGYLK